MGLRRGPGYLPGIFWIHLSSRNSIEPDPTDQCHDHGGGHVELQESLLREGEGGFCNAKPAEGALTRILTVLHSLCFSSHFLFGTFISMLAFWDHAKYYCLTERLSCIQFAFLCMIVPVYLTTIILDLPFCCDCLTACLPDCLTDEHDGAAHGCFGLLLLGTFSVFVCLSCLKQRFSDQLH